MNKTPLTLSSLERGGRYNWIGQKERLIFMGTKFYHGDRRRWLQFALVSEPDVCWSEVLEPDLENFEISSDDGH